MITSAIESGLLQGYGTSTAESDATPATDAPKAHAYRPDVDGLRAVAVLGVVVYHMSPSALPGGFFGVDIFFVISGYVVTGSLLSNTETTMSAYIAGFYARRVKRLTPALVLMVAVMAFLLRLLVESPPGHTAAWLPEDMKVAPPFDGYFLSGQLSLVGLANLYYATLKVSYFSQGTRSLEYNPFTHCWSLGVEEQAPRAAPDPDALPLPASTLPVPFAHPAPRCLPRPCRLAACRIPCRLAARRPPPAASPIASSRVTPASPSCGSSTCASRCS